MERSQTDRHADKHTDRETDRQKKVSITDQIQTAHFSHKYRPIFSIVSKNTDQDYFCGDWQRGQTDDTLTILKKSIRHNWNKSRKTT